MKHLTKTFLIFFILSLSAGSCKKDDDNNPSNDSDNFSEYFTCKINGVEFTGRSNFNCNGNTFYYYPAGAGGLDDGYMLIAGENCNENLSVFLRFFDPVVPSTGSFDITDPLCADSISPLVRHFISNDGVYKFEDEQSGFVTITSFSPRDSTTMEYGKLEGTFEFTVSNEELDSTIQVTDGAFRFKVANFWS